MHVVCKLKYFYLKIMGHFSHSKLKVSTAFFSPYYLDNMSCRHRWVIYTTEMNGKNTFWDVDGSMVPPECPSNEYSRLISFRIDWFDPLTVQRTLESFL
ncbi:hypothetical protein FD755_009787 [Muntiacus reevesi]|uniref:Uncharacterized protein n=1 Tax=Muntiacus reevesi TaxID=9886 RepID=A0A5N3XW92_MUNRE|nr:hypothetical protein FD755_009787 [Muntiacus reevesi]